MDLIGKNAVVVGAALGHGRAAALRLAADGARVALVDGDPAGLGELAAIIGARGGDAIVVSTVLDDRGGIEAAAAAVGEAFGAVHVLVNNHTRIHWGTFAECDLDVYAEIVRYILVGPVLASRAFLPLLKASGASSIIHIGSIDGLFGNPLSVAYSAAKGGLAPLTHIMARELAPFDIRVNTVAASQANQVTAAELDAGTYEDSSPAVSATASFPGGAGRFPGNWYLENLARATPLKRSGPPEEWAGMISFLASDDSSYVTGQVMVVDCGRTGLTPGTFPWDSPSTV